MAKRTDLTLLPAPNTEKVRETILDEDTSQPIDLTDVTVEFLIKPTDITADTNPAVVVLSTTTGEITVTDAPTGICLVTIPPQQPGIYWRRLDIINGADRHTAIYGPMHVISV